MKLIEIMPSCWIDSHVAAGNFGEYPENGAERYVVEDDIAANLDDNGYDHIVRDATPSDCEYYEMRDSL